MYVVSAKTCAIAAAAVSLQLLLLVHCNAVNSDVNLTSHGNAWTALCCLGMCLAGFLCLLWFLCTRSFALCVISYKKLVTEQIL